MMFSHGDRVRWETVGEDGLPLVRYGFVGGDIEIGEAVAVMLDGELKAGAVDTAQLVPVSVTSVVLHLEGDDLLGDADLRAGLVRLWLAEAETAGLDVGDVQAFGDGWCDDRGRWNLAELTTGGERYLVRAVVDPGTADVIHVHAAPA